MRKVIITAAVNGNRMDTDGTFIPVSPEEIGRDAAECRAAGAAVVHFHARDVRSRRSTADVAVFGAAIAEIRARCDALVETTTGIGPRLDPVTGAPLLDAHGAILRPSDDERLALIDLDPAQDLGAVSAGSMNMHNPVYARPSVFANSPYYIEESVRRMTAKSGMAFQFEVFDIGFLMNVRRLAEDGVLRRDLERWWLNFVLGFGGLEPEAGHLSMVLGEAQRLFPDRLWGALAPGPRHFEVSTVGSAMGAGVLRTGFEDSVHLPDGSLAGRNARLVEALVRIVRHTGREVASPQEARQMLGLAP